MKPQQIIFPEDKLIRAYYNRHPTVGAAQVQCS
jgi:hypothetical protein